MSTGRDACAGVLLIGSGPIDGVRGSCPSHEVGWVVIPVHHVKLCRCPPMSPSECGLRIRGPMRPRPDPFGPGRLADGSFRLPAAGERDLP